MKGRAERPGDSDKTDISPVPPPPPVAALPPVAAVPKRKTKKVKRKVKDKAVKAKRKTAKVTAKKLAKQKKQQKQKREDVIAKKRDPCKALETYGYVVSHGELHKRVIHIPANIRLIQYATPGAGMYGVDVYGIVHQLAEVRKGTANEKGANKEDDAKEDTIRLRKKVKRLDPPPILVSKLDGKIYVPDGNDLLITEPGEETTDMGLDFDMNYYHVSPLFGMHIVMPDGQVVWSEGCKPSHRDRRSPNTTNSEERCALGGIWPSQKMVTHTTLGALLADVSQAYAKKCPDRVLNFVQVSCKLNAWEPVEVVVDDKPVVQYKRGEKPVVMDVGNLAQMMKRGMHITSSIEKEAEKDVTVGATPEPTETVYGKTSDILDDYADRGATWDASFVPWLNANFHRVYDMASAKKWYRAIRGKRPVADKAVESYDVSESFVFK